MYPDFCPNTIRERCSFVVGLPFAIDNSLTSFNCSWKIDIKIIVRSHLFLEFWLLYNICKYRHCNSHICPRNHQSNIFSSGCNESPSIFLGVQHSFLSIPEYQYEWNYIPLHLKSKYFKLTKKHTKLFLTL